ncbi:uncharacterized protein TNCV_2726581 [Trichonephila clavipes]|nr:uncharacterized protein TNCV_2726581 [Trichonephila clavipes]
MIRLPVQVLVLSLIGVSSVIAYKGYDADFMVFNSKTDMCINKDFCEVWFLTESLARVAAIVVDHRCHTPRLVDHRCHTPRLVVDHRCHTPRHLFKETLDVFLGYSRPSSFHTLPKLIWCGNWGCNMGQSLSNHGPHIFYRQKIRRASRPGKHFNLVIDEEPLNNANNVCSRNILLKYGCGTPLKVRKDNWLQHLGDAALAL